MRIKLAAIGCLLAVSLVGTAAASVVTRFDKAALEDGADRIVEGNVSAIRTQWNSSHTGFETVVSVDVARTTKGVHAESLEIVQPGGTLEGMRHVIVGMPEYSVGQQARFFLREAGLGRYRVYGWKQGFWPAIANARSLHYQPSHLVENADETEVVHFTHNGMLWKPEQIPVAYSINEVGSDDLSLEEAKAAITAAFATWQDVPCSSLSYAYSGDTALGIAVDDTNVVLWIEADWIYGEEAAGATSLFFAPGETPTADVAFNGQGFTWAIGPVSVGTAIQDVQGVLTHELGHFSGLSHTQSALDTMYFSWTPWQSQRPLSADDKLGLCELYPKTGDECAGVGDCAEGDLCESYERGTLCSPQANAIGADCNYNKIDCEEFCLFTVANLSSGYCSRYCEVDNDCPDRFACNDASAGAMPVRVCFKDDTSRRLDAGPVEGSCIDSIDCDNGQYCGDDRLCTFDCREDFDCNERSQTCSSEGRCQVTSSGGCGCQAGGNRPWQGVWLLFALCGLWTLQRRRTRC